MTEEKQENLLLEDLPREIKAAVIAAQDKQAEEIQILELSAITSFTDYFIIMHGNSSKQLNALSDWIERSLRKLQVKPLSIEGKKNAEWVLMDYGSFIIHIFTKGKRGFYALERLWADVPKLDLPAEPEA